MEPGPVEGAQVGISVDAVVCEDFRVVEPFGVGDGADGGDHEVGLDRLPAGQSHLISVSGISDLVRGLTVSDIDTVLAV